MDKEVDLPQGTETILIVEDEDVVRELIREILESCGYHVLEAENGLKAMSIYEREGNNIDLVITDVVMPMMSGLALGDLLSFSHLQKRILYVSGYVEDGLGSTDVLEVDFNFVEKPFTPEILAQKVREILDRPKK